MARKWMTPVSIIVFILGIAMVVWSLTRSGDSTTSAVPDSAVVSEEESNGGSSSTAIAEGSSLSPDPTAVTASSSGVTTVTTSVPGASPAPTMAAPSATVRPVSPSVSVAPTTTVAPLSIPPLAATPGTVAPSACVSFKDCAQKLFDAWNSPDRSAQSQALNYATREAVNTLFYVRTIGVVWEPTVFRSTALKYVASGTSTFTGNPKGIEFIFTSGQTGYKVQSVVLF